MLAYSSHHWQPNLLSQCSPLPLPPPNPGRVLLQLLWPTVVPEILPLTSDLQRWIQPLLLMTVFLVPTHAPPMSSASNHDFPGYSWIPVGVSPLHSVQSNRCVDDTIHRVYNLSKRSDHILYAGLVVYVVTCSVSTLVFFCVTPWNSLPSIRISYNGCLRYWRGKVWSTLSCRWTPDSQVI